MFAAWLFAEMLPGHAFRSIPRPWWLYALVLNCCQGARSAACRIQRGSTLGCNADRAHIPQHSVDSAGIVALWLFAEVMPGHTFRSIPRAWWLYGCLLKCCRGTHSAAFRGHGGSMVVC